jgi:hypothetical protein
VLEDAVKHQRLDARWLKDPWGEPFKLVKRDRKQDHRTGITQFDHHVLISAGPDRKFGTADDVTLASPDMWAGGRAGLMGRGMIRGGAGGFNWPGAWRGMVDHRQTWSLFTPQGRGFQGGGGFGGFAPGMPGGAGMGAGPRGVARPDELGIVVITGNNPSDSAAPSSSAAPTRIREYFPETLLWQPALITDDRGRADLPLTFADSITTWRLTASASSRGGALGGTTAALRVFQDFFVDLDLPVSLTQNDEVAFPVGVYNYLKEPQTVRLDLQAEPWFELVDPGGLSRSLPLKPGEVTSVRFRIKAKKLGSQPLTVKAAGSKLSDAIKRSIEVVPDGQRVEQVASDRLAGRITQTITIPEHAIPDSYKLLVKLYPGVMSQVLEGTEGMLRLPGG